MVALADPDRSVMPQMIDNAMICSEISINEKTFLSIFLVALFILVPFTILYCRFLKRKYGIFTTKFHGKYSILNHKKEFTQQSWIHKFFYSAILTFSLGGGIVSTLILAQMLLCSFYYNFQN